MGVAGGAPETLGGVLMAPRHGLMVDPWWGCRCRCPDGPVPKQAVLVGASSFPRLLRATALSGELESVQRGMPGSGFSAHP